MTSSLKKTLGRIHNQVFSGFIYKTDKENYGELEYWAMPKDSIRSNGIVGDCEDFALFCRKLCREEDLKTRLVLCLTEDDEGHLVLECEGWILDNRQHGVVKRQDLPYTWIRISGYEPGDDWHDIDM